MLDIKLLTNELGDWEGLYIDDELVIENHSISLEEAMLILKNKLPISYKNIEVPEEQLEDWGYAYPDEVGGYFWEV